jgi:UDPglucose 6-dehydrogenase
LVEMLVNVNEQQKLRMVDKIVNALGVSASNGDSLTGRTIGLLGLAFKPNTDDIRDAPSLTIIRELQRRGAHVQAFDPAAMDQAQQFLIDVDYRVDPYDAAQGADALVLVTEWNEFRNLDLNKMKELMRRPLFLDLRNVYEPDKVKALGFEYYGVGRG